jgi:pyruvate formate lyase activating enzyme
MQIGGLQRLTLIDYPGKIACTVFLIGCNFRCSWCYSAELVLPEKIKKQPRISEKDFFDFLKERKGLLEGVVICGGEPTINKELPNFIKKIKKLGYLIKLDTNGSNPGILKKLIVQKLIDYVAMDIKTPIGVKIQNTKCESQNDKSKFKNKYELATGIKINLKNIRKSVELIKNSGIDYKFRTTVVPTIHTKEDILQIAKDIAPARAYYLQNFRPEKTIDPSFIKIKPYSDKIFLEIKKEIAKFFKICEIRT